MNNKDFGTKGEVLAIKFLKDKGYSILEVNWRFKHKEIDIIAFNEECLCIVEVKTRSSSYISPKDAVTKKKQKNLIVAANEYVMQKSIDNDVRFDIVEIIIEDNNRIINHIEDAFIPQLWD